MGRLLTAFGILAAIASSGFAVRAQQPAPAGAAATAPATGLIVGHVVDGDTGASIAGAFVGLAGDPRAFAAGRTGEDLMAALRELAAVARNSGASNLSPVVTDGNGRFLFRDLAQGRYSLTASLPGYVTSAYGQTRPEGPARTIDLADNERLIDVKVRIWRFSALFGTIVDEAGDPAVNVSVAALRRSSAGGRRTVSVAARTFTDDRGQYRIAGLIPGEYLVMMPSDTTTMPTAEVEASALAIRSGTQAALSAIMQERRANGAPGPLANGVRVGDLQVGNMTNRLLPPLTPEGNRTFVYPATFYPAATALSEAAIVRLSSGEEHGGVDIQIRPAWGVQVSGVASMPDGPAARTGVVLVPAADEIAPDRAFAAASTLTTSSGQFTFLGVTPGAYVLMMSRIPLPAADPNERNPSIVGGMTVATPGQVRTPSFDTTSYWAMMPVTVGDADVDGLAVAFRPGARVTGRIEFAAGTAPKPSPAAMQRIGVRLRPVDGPPVVPGAGWTTDDQGRFTTAGFPPGRYWITASTADETWSLASITAGPANLIDQPVELGTNDVAGVVITFSDRPIEIAGSVQGDASDVHSATVLAFPADYESWIANGMNPGRTATAPVARSGAYSLRVPTAGDYFLVAANTDAPDGDPRPFYAALSKTATRVSVAPGDRRTHSLSVSRVR